MMKKILIILDYLPYPPTSGGNIGVFEMINHFRKVHQITITFLSYKQNDKKNTVSLKQRWPDVEIIPFTRSFKERILNSLYYRIQHIFYKFTCSHFFSGITQDKLFYNLVENMFAPTKQLCDRYFLNYINNNILKKKPYDLIQVEFYNNISAPVFLKSTCPVIFIHHELRFVRDKRIISIVAPENKILRTMNAQLKAYEMEMLKNFDKVVLLSEIDKNALSPYLSENLLYVSPLGIKKEQNPNSKTFVFNNTITFLGAEEHFPNKDGLTWFLKNCFPLLKQKCPAIKLHVIGKWNKEFISKYECEDIKFFGFVEDLDNALSNSIMIVPIRIGSGIRMKIIDSINTGIPFVTTTIGVEGWDFRNNIDCFIADSANEYVSCLLQLISDEQLQNLFIQNSQIRFDELYSFEKAIKKRQELYDNIFQTAE